MCVRRKTDRRQKEATRKKKEDNIEKEEDKEEDKKTGLVDDLVYPLVEHVDLACNSTRETLERSRDTRERQRG